MEPEVLARIAEGDEMAFSELIQQYANRIYPYLIYWLKKTHIAEEIMQDIFISLWQNRQRLKDIDNLPGYIFSMTRNRTNTALKQQLGSEPLDPDRLYSILYNQTAASNLESKELMAILEQGIQQLPARRKEVFVLSRIEELTYDQIAERLGISRSAVRQHIVEALVFLRHFIKQHAGIILSILLWCVNCS